MRTDLLMKLDNLYRQFQFGRVYGPLRFGQVAYNYLVSVEERELCMDDRPWPELFYEIDTTAAYNMVCEWVAHLPKQYRPKS